MKIFFVCMGMKGYCELSVVDQVDSQSCMLKVFWRRELGVLI